MTKHTIIYSVLLAALSLGGFGCKKQLQVGDPNSATVGGNITSEAALIELAQGAVYINGFKNGDGWLGDSYFGLPWTYVELMGDISGGGEGSNNQTTTIGVPDYILLDNGSKLSNPSPQVALIRQYNTRSSTADGNNPLYYQWLNMYAMNNACNVILAKMADIKFGGDAVSRTNTLKAWCYFWKGYAYASVGTMYYSGLIIDAAPGASNNYLPKDSILERSNYYYKLASATLGAITNAGDYGTVLGKLIPSFCQVGLGGVMTVDQWNRSINTLLARNILLNKLSPFVNGNPDAAITKSSTTNMSAADWNEVLAYAANGIKMGDLVFTGRTLENNYFFSPSGGSIAALSTGSATATTIKVSERLIQDFKPGDLRLANNFATTDTFVNNYSFTTAHSLIDGGKGTSGVISYGTTNAGDYELYIAGSYEENALMLAEANIRLGNTEAGLAYVDAVRSFQGAGVAATVGTSLLKPAALAELVKERRAALAFRGFSFYDARRWGWTYDIANGGGAYGCKVITQAGVANFNATINYNYMDYWDVPADESAVNPAKAGSAAILNPNF